MSDFHLVDPKGWEYDLQSVYSAYMGHFQLHCVPWHDRTWGQFFETFEQFLAFSWPVITVTDTRTGRAHIVTRLSSILAFLKMIKSRFGETLPQVDNMLVVTPFETAHRQLRHVDDSTTYKKLHAVLPAVTLAALKTRVRAGDPDAIRQLWAARDKTFFAIDFECPEGYERTCVEWGYAAIRSGHLVAAGAWPPVPDANYRKGHYLISDYANMIRKASSTTSWQYAFGESQMISKAKLPRVIQSILSSLLSPESETVANNVVLVGHGIQVLMQRLDEMKIKLPTNVLVVDIAYLERSLFATGERGPMHEPRTGKARAPGSLLSLAGLLRSFAIEAPCVLQHAGNDAFMTLVAFQRMVDAKGGVGRNGGGGVGASGTPGHEDGLVSDNGMRNGNGNGATKGQGSTANQNGSEQGHKHVKRPSSVASRLFRPLSGAQSPTQTQTHSSTHPNGADGVHGRPHHIRHSHSARLVRLQGADEMGVMSNGANPKRSSMLSAWRYPSLVEERGESASPGSTTLSGKSGSVSGKSGTGSLRVKWLSPGHRRHSTLVEDQR